MQYDMEIIIYKLYIDIKHKEMHWEFTEIKVNKNKKILLTFFEHEISAAITNISSKFETWIHTIHMEGRVSQNCDIGLSFYLRKCRT